MTSARIFVDAPGAIGAPALTAGRGLIAAWSGQNRFLRLLPEANRKLTGAAE